jgi:hypothetical protein
MRERDATMDEQQDELTLWLSRKMLTLEEVECLLVGISPSQYRRLKALVVGSSGASLSDEPDVNVIASFELLEAKIEPAKRLVDEAWSTKALPFNRKERTAEWTVAMSHVLLWVDDAKVVSVFFKRVAARRVSRTYTAPVGDELKKRLALWRMKPSYSAFEVAALMSGNEPDTFADILEVMEYGPTDMIFFLPVFAGAKSEVDRAIESGALPTEREGCQLLISNDHVVRWLKSKGVADGFFVTEGAIHNRILELEATNAALSSQLATGRRRGELETKGEVTEREHNTYVGIIGSLLQTLISPTQLKTKFHSQALLIKHLVENFPNVAGVKKSTLENKFAEGKRAIGLEPEPTDPP